MFGKDRNPPLHKRLTSVSQADVIRTVEGDAKHKLPQVTAYLVMMCAGHFLKNSAPNMTSLARTMNREVLAVETLAFCLYAVRELNSPLEQEDERTRLAFAASIAVCEHFADKDTGWKLGPVLESRLMSYAGSPDYKTATEQFALTLTTARNAKVPTARYPEPPIDLRDTMEALTAVSAFAVNMPPAIVQTLRGIRSEFRL